MTIGAPPAVTPPSPDELELLIREARARQRRRRLLAVLGIVACAAVAYGAYAATGSRVPARRQAADGGRAAAAQLPRCRSGQLRLSAPKMWGAAAGSLIEPFTLTNTSGTSCAVGGWPAIRRLDAAGQRISTRLSRWVYVERGAAPFHAVGLRPGGAASFAAFGQDWNHQADRGCRTAKTVEVEPRGGGGWLSVALDIPACSLWLVGPLVPGRVATWPQFALSAFYSPPTRRHPFYAGRENGTSWRLGVRDSGDGRYCFKVFTNGSLRGSRCGRFYGPSVPGKLGFVYRKGGAEPAFVAGAVISMAQVVAIHLSRGYPLHIQTMQPTRILAPGISFFFTTVPPGTRPVSIVGRTLGGRRVVSWHRP